MKNKDFGIICAIFLILFGGLGVILMTVMRKALEISSSFIIVDCAFGFIALLGVIILFARISKFRSNKNLKEKGQVIKAKFMNSEKATWISNKGDGYIMHFIWHNENDGKDYNFVHKCNLWLDPQIIINEKNIEIFDVYVSPKNPNKYLVDISSITNNIIDLTNFGQPGFNYRGYIVVQK